MKNERGNMNTDINDIKEFKELKVNLNYSTGNYGENACRIVSKGSRLDQMYARAYQEYLKIDQKEFEEQELDKKIKEWNEKKRPSQQQEPQRDGAGEWILS